MHGVDKLLSMKTRLLPVDPSVGTPTGFPNAAELAVLRAWHAGLSTREAVERYKSRGLADHSSILGGE